MAKKRTRQKKPAAARKTAAQEESRLQLLLRVTQAINETEDFQSAIAVALRNVCESTGWDYAEAWIPSLDATALERSPLWYGISKAVEDFRNSTVGIRRSPGLGLIGRVWSSRQPEWIPDVSVNPGLFYRFQAAREAGLKAAFGLPILAADQVIAVLVFFMFESRDEDKRLVEIVSAVAAQLGSVLQRKQVEQALRESERRFHAIFDQTFQFVGLLKPDGTLLEANQTALNFRGLKRPDVVGRPFWETAWWDISRETQDRLKAAVAEAAQGKFIRYEVDHLDHNGAVGTFDFSLKPVTDEGGKVFQIIAEGRNITERKRTERALQESEARLQAIMDNSSAVIFLKDLQGRYLLVNREYESLFHVAREQIKGKSDYDIFPKKMADALRENDVKVLEAKSPLEFEETVLQDDGLHTYIANKFPMFDSAGLPYAVCGIATDISERKRAEEQDVRERQRAETWLQSLIDTTQDALISIDRQGHIVLFNPAAEQMFGYARGEVEGRKINLLMTEPHASEHDNYIARYEQTRGRRALSSIRTVAGRRKNGEVFPIELSLTEVTTLGEVRYAAFLRDISEKIKLQEQLIENERLAAIGTTAAKLAHEIGNPLNGMYMTIQLLERRLAKQKDSLDDTVQSTMQTLKDEITRLNQLLYEFRSLSRREKYRFRPTALAVVAAEVLEMESSRYHVLDIRVEQRFPDDLPLVPADGEKLKQALLNLCKNAVEAMPQGGTLTLRARNPEGQVVLEVVDTGLGIPDEVDIFEPFATTKNWGTGLGLVIVRQIVTAHGGTITYTSERGRGTVFRLSLPLSPPHPVTP